jgi:hypothetical protein
VWFEFQIQTSFFIFKPSNSTLVLELQDDERLIPDLPRGRGRSIGGDLDVGEEVSKQTIVTLQSLHHDPVGYQHMRT